MNQVLITTLQVNASIDKKLPSADPVNMSNFTCELTDQTGVNQCMPPSMIIQPGASVTLTPAAASGLFLFVKSDVALSGKFSTPNSPFPIASFFAMSGDFVALGNLVLTNTSATDVANVEVLATGK